MNMIRKNIDIDSTLLQKLKILSVFEDVSVKKLMETAVSSYVIEKEKERFDRLTDSEKEDLGLLLLMQQSDSTKTVSEKEIFDILDKE